MEFEKSFSATGGVATNNTFLDGEVSSRRHTILGSPNGRRRSSSSLQSEFRSIASVSCVTRQTSGDDCARQKFIVWAAVKRNRSMRMPSSERLKCPLLRCQQRFYDHETMLRHVETCQHLTSGEYMCYDCDRKERFNGGKCKCCFGHPTKRRRIINLAKSFFTELGHKSRKDGATLDPERDEYPVPPPSYDSLEIEQQTQAHAEVGGTEILELAGSIPLAQLDAINYETQQINVFEHSTLGEMENSSIVPPVASRTMMPPKLSFLHQNEPIASPVGRPTLALDTLNVERPRKIPRTQYLSPSSSLQSASSSQNISPISAASGTWTMTTSSIDTTLASPITPFSPSGLGSASLSRENSCKFPREYPIELNEFNWSEMGDKSSAIPGPIPTEADNYALDDVCELPGDDPLNLALPRVWGENPFLFCFDAKDNYSWSSSINTEVNVLFASDETKATEGVSQQELSRSEVKTIVETTWDALQEHISCSVAKTAHVQNNPLADLLHSHTAKEIASAGLSSLKEVLNGTDPTDPFDYLCFAHVAFAFSLIVHEDDLAERCSKLFTQALAYRGNLDPRHYASYSEVVTAIWQPLHHDEALGTSLNRSSSLKGKEPEYRLNSRAPIKADSLVNVAQNFLDDLEYSVANGDTERTVEVLTSDLWSIHVSDIRPNSSPNDAFAITASYIVSVLNQKFLNGQVQNQDLSKKLRTINDRVNAGCITTVRRLELELVQAGKNCMPPTDLFDEFIPHVRDLCDPIYPQGSHPRRRYHTLGIGLIESFFQNARISQPQEEVPSGFALNITAEDHDPLNDLEFLQNLESFGNMQNVQDEFMMPVSVGEAIESSIAAATDVRSTAVTTSVEATTSSTLQPPTETKTMHDEFTAELFSLSRTHEAGSPSQGQKTEANSCCEICGYRPKGDPQWFKGSMAKHKKLQHSQQATFYKCPFPGCTSTYKNRPDNLRQHQTEKGHLVDGGHDEERRPGKRKKMESMES